MAAAAAAERQNDADAVDVVVENWSVL